MYIHIFYQIQNILAITSSNILFLSGKIIRCLLACFPNYKIRIDSCSPKLFGVEEGVGCAIQFLP